MADQFSMKQRVLATIQGERVDRPPYGFWRHFYEAEFSVTRHVASMIWWQNRVQNDFLKVQPRASVFVEDWGTVFRYPTSGVMVGGEHHGPEESVATPFEPAPVAHEKPVRVDFPVKSVEDWEHLRILPPDEGALGERLLALRMIRDGLPGDVPFIETVFSPLSIAARLVGSDDEMVQYIRHRPQVVHEALDVITRTFSPFAQCCLEAGANGIFFATTQWASRDRLTEAEYAEFGRPYDLRILEAVREAPFNVLHVCESHNMLFSLSDYPVHAVNWSVSGPGNPGLKEAQQRIPGKALIGGVSQAALAEPTPDRAIAEARQAGDATDGRRWMAGPDCSVPVQAPVENVQAVGRLLQGRTD